MKSNRIFQPNYSLINFRDVLTLIVLGVFALLYAVNRRGLDLEVTVGCLAFVIFCLRLSHFLIRRVVFSDSGFYVERYIWSTKSYKYTDVTDIGNTVIKTRKGNIDIIFINNARELLALFMDLLKKDSIDVDLIKGKILAEESIHSKAVGPSIIIAIILWSILIFYWPYYGLLHNEFLLMVALFLCGLLAYSTVRLVVKKVI